MKHNNKNKNNITFKEFYKKLTAKYNMIIYLTRMLKRNMMSNKTILEKLVLKNYLKNQNKNKLSK